MTKKRSTKLNVLNNKYVLYLVSFLAILDIVAYLNMQDYISFFVFICVAIIFRLFTKNLNIVILSAIIISSITSFSLYKNTYYEGMENKKKNKINIKKSRFENLKNLQNKLGKKGIEGLTTETSHLMNKQSNLVEQISKLEPMMDKASKMLDRLERGGAINKMNKMMSSFNK